MLPSAPETKLEKPSNNLTRKKREKQRLNLLFSPPPNPSGPSHKNGHPWERRICPGATFKALLLVRDGARNSPSQSPIDLGNKHPCHISPAENGSHGWVGLLFTPQ